MKYTVHIITGLIGVAGGIISLWLLALGFAAYPGPPALLQVMVALAAFVVASASGAISLCTYMSPPEREEARLARAERRARR